MKQNPIIADDVDVPSPCIKLCRLGAHGHCLGCGRDLDEIAAWARATSAQRRQIRDRAAARLLDFPNDEDAA
ncbi:DUF1289 domain-containing protein [Solimonas marina]|uniref:DUF1289 domain-containing protein n=1 Tax=Solimonas marina TaxID=2714601 RepID=A0A969WBK3_9GAMM|nr:DUF1289 domain-containing protein [Solimonas marina]NKF23095.1 DUF1289 domain-containing protein [Solimonas marina]